MFVAVTFSRIDSAIPLAGGSTNDFRSHEMQQDALATPPNPDILANRCRVPLAPDLARGFDDEPQLGDFFIEGQRVAVDRRRKAALRAEAKLIERHVLGGLVDPALQLVLVFERPALGGDRPSTTILPLGTKRSGSKPPERASSYSRKKPSTLSSPNSASATWS